MDGAPTPPVRLVGILRREAELQVSLDRREALVLRFQKGVGAAQRAERVQDGRREEEAEPMPLVVRVHGDENVVHPEGRVDPLADAETIETELIMADLEQAERRAERVVRQARWKFSRLVRSRASASARR